MEEYTQPEGEVHLEPPRENRQSEQPEVQPVTKQQRRNGKENDKKKKRTEMKFPKFNPNLASLDLDPPNIFAPPPKRKKIDLPIDLSISSSLPACCSQLLHNLMNKIRKFV